MIPLAFLATLPKPVLLPSLKQLPAPIDPEVLRIANACAAMAAKAQRMRVQERADQLFGGRP